MHNLALAQLAAALRAKQFSSLELTRHFLARIKQHDGALNSFITVTEEQALAAARGADQRLAKRDDAPLLGVPFAQKDIFSTAGVRTSCGSNMLDNFGAPGGAAGGGGRAGAGAGGRGGTGRDGF